MKMITTDNIAKWKEEFKFLDTLAHHDLVHDAIKYFKEMLLIKYRGNVMSRYKRSHYKRVCASIRNPKPNDKIGDISLFTDFCILLIKNDWMTKDEVIEELLKETPSMDALIEVIRYDKPLCVNRWEI